MSLANRPTITSPLARLHGGTRWLIGSFALSLLSLLLITTQGHAADVTLAFDGRDDGVLVNDAASLDLTTAMTIELWVLRTQRMSGWHCPLLKERVNGLVYSLCANSDTDQPATVVHIDGDRNLAGGSWLRRYRWTHLAATYDGSTQRLYVDGNEVAKQPLSGSIQTSDQPLYLGGNPILDEFFRGRIDEVRIYNRALSADEIRTDMTTPVLQ